MAENSHNDKRAIHWSQEFRYGLASLLIYLVLQQLALLADMWPIDSFRRVVQVLYGFVMGMNVLPLYIVLSAPFLLIIPILSGPIGARVLKGWRGALIFSVLGATLNIWIAGWVA